MKKLFLVAVAFLGVSLFSPSVIAQEKTNPREGRVVRDAGNRPNSHSQMTSTSSRNTGATSRNDGRTKNDVKPNSSSQNKSGRMAPQGKGVGTSQSKNVGSRR